MGSLLFVLALACVIFLLPELFRKRPVRYEYPQFPDGASSTAETAAPPYTTG